MKLIGGLVFLAALGLLGSAFFGVYTAPGLERLPTVESIGKQRMETKAGQGVEEKKPSGVVIPVNKNGKMIERNNYLNQQRGVVAPGS